MQKQVVSRPCVGSTVFGARAAREAASSPSRACASASVMLRRTPASSMPPLRARSAAMPRP
ncbi:hypothetical protein [Blastococcus brunescens]|uniref:Uncharacterized protein n=1 Tax=Blastococcus brunescens TaxID=1564165 RepID=A0ABZ1AY09_9ACTN|nr:hypothetical protein [Blastococcus sp. BMG 8361]WRL63017.1 hypothetical protein U6N30_24685 [Blastococcus sp. BMG 8361]